MPEVLALIPARGGSKAIPRKNIREIGGKPLIAWTIEHAINSKLINRVIVSTDDQEIAEIAQNFGAEIPFLRPAEYARDESLDFDVFFHALTWLKQNDNYSPEAVVHLRPTGPVRDIKKIDLAISTFLSNPDADSLRSVSWPQQTPYKMWSIKDGLLKPLLKLEGTLEPFNQPRQKLPEVFWQNGYIDIMKPSTVLDKKCMSGESILPFVINEPIYELDYEDNIPELEKVLKNITGGQTEGREDIKRYPV